MQLQKLIKIMIVVFVVFSQTTLVDSKLSFAGPLLASTDKLPQITSIMPNDKYIWFASTYDGCLIVRFNLENESWKSFYHPFHDKTANGEIKQTEEEVLFVYNDHTVTLNKKSGEWKEEVVPQSSGEGLKRYGVTYNSNKFAEILMADRTFTKENKQYVFLDSYIYRIEGDRITRILELPRLTTSMLLRYRPGVKTHFGYNERSFEFSDVVASIDNKIGPLERIGDRIWFGLTFYEGEGWEGVGGLGFFDIQKEKIGISRPAPLRHCSVSNMAVDGEWLWLTTQRSGEDGAYGCSGLIKFNIAVRLKQHSLYGLISNG